jgi:Arc/MetJ family transcription regulator
VVGCHTIWQMRTTLDLDDALIAGLAVRHPNLSKTQAIELAVRSYLAADAAERLRKLAGAFDIEDVSKELRALDRHT